jgi:Coenzyme PQQ synthesis protein D (PqqD)
MPIDEPTRPMRPTSDVIFRALGDGGVLVHLQDNQIFELNATATHIWMQIVEGAGVDAIVQSVIETFDVDGETASHHVRELIDRLVERDLLQW